VSRFNVPVSKPQPDIRRFLAAMQGRKVPDKVPLVEYLIDTGHEADPNGDDKVGGH
jgi:hypothetical protein